MYVYPYTVHDYRSIGKIVYHTYSFYIQDSKLTSNNFIFLWEMAANCLNTVVVTISLAVVVGLASAMPAEESESYYVTVQNRIHVIFHCIYLYCQLPCMYSYILCIYYNTMHINTLLFYVYN